MSHGEIKTESPAPRAHGGIQSGDGTTCARRRAKRCAGGVEPRPRSEPRSPVVRQANVDVGSRAWACSAHEPASLPYASSSQSSAALASPSPLCFWRQSLGFNVHAALALDASAARAADCVAPDRRTALGSSAFVVILAGRPSRGGRARRAPPGGDSLWNHSLSLSESHVLAARTAYFTLIRPAIEFADVPYSATLFLSPRATANTAAVDENEDI